MPSPRTPGCACASGERPSLRDRQAPRRPRRAAARAGSITRPRSSTGRPSSARSGKPSAIDPREAGGMRAAVRRVDVAAEVVGLRVARTHHRARARARAGQRRAGPPLLRPHLHDGRLPASGRPPADRSRRVAAGAEDGRPVDDLGARDRRGRAADRRGGLRARRSKGAPLPPRRAPGVRRRRRRATPSARRSTARGTDAAARKVRKLVDCCSRQSPPDRRRRARCGLCYRSRKMFCVMYFEAQRPVLTAPALIGAAVVGGLRRIVAVRPVDGRDARAGGLRRAPARARCSPARRSPPARWPAAPRRSGRSRSPGRRYGAGNPVALGAAAIVAMAAAAGRGARRPHGPPGARQVPEHWRRVLPVPLAAAGYGALLGPRLHHLRPHLRRLGAGRDQRRARRPRPRGRARARLRGGSRAPRDRLRPGGRRRA